MALPACAEFDYATFVDREPEIARLKQIVSFSLDQKEEEKPRDYQRVLHLVGKSNVGKTCLLRNYDNYLDKQKVISISLSFENFNHLSDERFIIDVLNFLNEKIAPFLGYQPGNKPEMNASGLSNILTKELIHLQKKSVVAFLLDEVSMLSEGKVEMLEDSFLSNILPLSNVVVVLAGRHVVTKWKEIALRPTKGKNIVELLGFGFEYTQEQILAMDSRVIDLKVEIHDQAAVEIASRSRGTPRIANALLRRVRDFAQVKGNGIIDIDITRYSLEALNIDKSGLDEMDNKILNTIIDKFAGGPVGISTIATAVGEDAGTIEEVYEPFLIKEGYIKRTSRGREATATAYMHLGKLRNDQNRLF